MPQQPVGAGAAETRADIPAADGSGLARVPIQEPAAEAERDLSRGHPDPRDLSGTADPSPADGEDPRPRGHDRLYMQRELHPAVFTVMDGTVAGDGAGPRTMIPRVKNLLLAASDSVAIDAIAARLMGFDPLSIPFLRMAHERGLGIADPKQIELVGDDVSTENFGFQTRKSLVIWGDQMIRKGFLRPLERILLHSPLMVWAPIASNVYHDMVWYPTIGQSRIREFMRTEWGQLFRKY